MKKAEAAAYAEAQTKGTAWLPAPLRSATTPQDDGGVAALGSDEDDEATADDEMNTFSEAAE